MVVDQSDYNTWKANFGLFAVDVGPGITDIGNVPEPSTLLLALGAVLLLPWRRGR